MANVISQDKAKIIARCFAETNFGNKHEALRKTGLYKEKYIISGRSKIVYDNARVKEEIAKIQAENKEMFDIKNEEQIEWAKKVRKEAFNAKQFTAALAANDQLNKHIGFYNADTSNKSPQSSIIQVFKSETELDRIELELIQKQKALGDAVCKG